MDFDLIGPVGDRRWMVVSPDGQFVSQRQVSGLAAIHSSLSDAGVTVRHPRLDALFVPDPPPDGELLRVRVWASALDARSGGAQADAWISEALQGEFRLVHMGVDNVRMASPLYAPNTRVSFADGYPALVVGEGSVREVSRRVGRDIPVERFRPNIVVATDEPHAEDRWRRFKIGSGSFEGVKQCARCVVTTRDQTTGSTDPQGEPLRTLSTYRQASGGVWFGINVVGEEGASVSVGDRLVVTDWTTIPAPPPA